jgi:hypothetical protein
MLTAEYVLRHRHTPFLKVLHGWHSNLAREPFREDRTGHARRARKLRNRPPPREIDMDLAKRSCQPGIRETREQTLLLPCRGLQAEPERLDEKDLDKALENQIMPGTNRVGFLADQFYDPAHASGSFLGPPDVNDRRQQPNEKLGVCTVDTEVPAEHPHRRRAGLGTVTRFTRLGERDVSRGDTEITPEREAWHFGEENEVALL